MGTAAGLIAQARATLGLGESPAGSNHNKITAWYNANIARIGDGAWCDQAVTYWAARSDNLDAIGAGRGVGYAYTVWHAEKFQQRGRWHPGSAGIKPGDVVFFDWTGSRRIGAIDHVGVVEHVSGGLIYTIEGNKGDRCVRVARDGTYIVGYGRPAYTKAEDDDMPEPKDLWNWDGIAAPPWIAEGGNKDWTPASYLVWLYRNQAKQSAQLAALAQASGAEVDTDAIVAGVLAGLSPDAIARHVVDALPPDLAMQVVDGIGARLAPPGVTGLAEG
jgi:hypothetical protein